MNFTLYIIERHNSEKLFFVELFSPYWLMALFRDLSPVCFYVWLGNTRQYYRLLLLVFLTTDPDKLLNGLLICCVAALFLGVVGVGSCASCYVQVTPRMGT